MRSHAQYRRQTQLLQPEFIGLVSRHLRATDFSRRCTVWVLFSCLLLAAVARASLAAVASLKGHGPNRETLRQALLATLPGYEELVRGLPRLLKEALPKSFRRRIAKGRQRRLPMAIDLHTVPYYKRDSEPPPHTRKGQRKAGTRYGHQYATCSVLLKGRFFVVGLTPYTPGESYAEVVRRLLKQVAQLGLKPRYLLLDRGFWSVGVLDYLKRARCPFLLPALARGKTANAPGGPTGTQAYWQKPSGRYPYRLADPKRGVWLTLLVIHRRERNSKAKGRRDRHGRQTLVYGLWGCEPQHPLTVFERYRRRFRIESSYRLLEEARARTSSRDERVRLWYVIQGALLLNLWLGRRPSLGEGRWFCRLLRIWLFELLQEPAQPSASAKPSSAETQAHQPRAPN